MFIIEWQRVILLVRGLYLERSYDEIIFLANFYIVSAIPIRYDILHIDIIIF